jgi:hypothetical protein
MKLSQKTLLAVLASVLALFLAGQSAAQATKEKPAKAPSPLAPITDDPQLPRILLIGDSISMGYTIPVRELLKGKANVHHPVENCGPTTRGVEKLDEWLGKGPWKIIHFNFGLHDLKDVEGKPNVPLADYEKNLRAIVKRLKATGAALVWCSTTPVPKKSGSPPRRNEDVIAYNAVAKKIMDENHIPIDDLYAFVLPQEEKIQRKNNVHFTPDGYGIIAGQVVKSVRELAATKDSKASPSE